MAIAPIAAPVYSSAAQLAQFPGPLTNQRYAIVDGIGLFRWYASDTTAEDSLTVIAPSGGGIGRWKLSAAFPGASSFQRVDVIATSPLDLSGLETIDGVSLAAGAVVLPIAQTNAAQNVPWVVSAGTWTRPTWFDTSAEALPGMVVSVLRGTVNGGTLWRMSSPTSGTITLGTTEIQWAEIQSGAELSDATPAAVGTASAGVALTAARADHVHALGASATVTSSGETVTLARTGANAWDLAGIGSEVVSVNGVVPAGELAAAAFSSALTLDTPKKMTATADGDGKIIVGLASAGHVDGQPTRIDIAANELALADDLILASDLNISGDAFDPTQATRIYVVSADGLFFATLISIPARDVTAPTVVSANVPADDMDALVVTYDKPVISTTAGLSLTGAGGRSITGVASGSGTAAVTYSVSSAFTGAETANFVAAASNGVQGLNGPALGAASEPIEFAVIDPLDLSGVTLYLHHEDFATSGSDITDWPDRGPGNRDFTTGGGARPTINAGGGKNGGDTADFDKTISARFTTTLALSQFWTVSDGYLLVRFKPHTIVGVDANIFSNETVVGISSQTWGVVLRDEAPDKVRAYNHDGTVDANAHDVVLNGWNTFEMWHTGGNLSSRLNGGSVTTIASGNTGTPGGLVRIGYANGASQAFDGEIDLVLMRNVAGTSQERDDIYEWSEVQ